MSWCPAPLSSFVCSCWLLVWPICVDIPRGHRKLGNTRGLRVQSVSIRDHHENADTGGNRQGATALFPSFIAPSCSHSHRPSAPQDMLALGPLASTWIAPPSYLDPVLIFSLTRQIACGLVSKALSMRLLGACQVLLRVCCIFLKFFGLAAF